MNLINELRMLAEDLHSAGGHSRYAAALSKAADELESLQRYRTAFNEWIDKTEWRQKSLHAKYLGMHRADALKDLISELFGRLEAAEKERDDVAQQLVQSEIDKREISEARDALQVEVGKLKDLEVTRCVKINGYIVDNARLAEEVERLRAKIEAMEKQVPVGTLHDDGCFVWRETAPHQSNYAGWKMVLYALPGAQPQLNEIKTALQRALELGQRETWTGARKHRSWQDQREEQQCWNKVWSLLGAKGEDK